MQSAGISTPWGISAFFPNSIGSMLQLYPHYSSGPSRSFQKKGTATVRRKKWKCKFLRVSTQQLGILPATCLGVSLLPLLLTGTPIHWLTYGAYIQNIQRALDHFYQSLETKHQVFASFCCFIDFIGCETTVILYITHKSQLCPHLNTLCHHLFHSPITADFKQQQMSVLSDLN